jgi:hypothetical protein
LLCIILLFPLTHVTTVPQSPASIHQENHADTIIVPARLNAVGLPAVSVLLTIAQGSTAVLWVVWYQQEQALLFAMCHGRKQRPMRPLSRSCSGTMCQRAIHGLE